MVSPSSCSEQDLDLGETGLRHTAGMRWGKESGGGGVQAAYLWCRGESRCVCGWSLCSCTYQCVAARTSAHLFVQGAHRRNEDWTPKLTNALIRYLDNWGRRRSQPWGPALIGLATKPNSDGSKEGWGALEETNKEKQKSTVNQTIHHGVGGLGGGGREKGLQYHSTTDHICVRPPGQDQKPSTHTFTSTVSITLTWVCSFV